MPFRYVNRRGSVYLVTTGVSVNDTNVVYSFMNHAFLDSPYRGTVYINLQQSIPTGTTTTLPIVFETNGIQQSVTKFGGDELTVADLSGTGIYQFWYDKSANVLQLM